MCAILPHLLASGGKKSFPPAPPLPGSEAFGNGAHAEEAATVVDPPYYQHGAVEAIELIESLGYGKGYCYGCAVKYLYRAEHKDSELENLKKALWYIERRIKQIGWETEGAAIEEKDERYKNYRTT